MKYLTLYLFISIIFPITYLLQVSAWSNKSDAEIDLKKVDKLNLNAYIEEYNINKKSIWRVRVGDFPTIDAANTASNVIFNNLEIKPWLLKIDLENNSIKVSKASHEETINKIVNSKTNINPNLKIKIDKQDDNNKTEKLIVEEELEINKTDSMQNDTSTNSISNKDIKRNISKIDSLQENEFIYFDIPPSPKAGYEIKPVYPNEAKSSGIEGKATVKFFVDKKGLASKIQILKSSNFQILDDVAIDAVLKSEWIPAKVKDVKIGVWQTTTINFKL